MNRLDSHELLASAFMVKCMLPYSPMKEMQSNTIFKHAHYKIGVLTNLNSGQSMTDLGATAAAGGITFDQIAFPTIPLSDLRNSSLLSQIEAYDVVYYRTGMRGPVIAELQHILNERNIPLVNGNAKYIYTHQKIRQALIADRYGIKQPKSLYPSSYDFSVIAKELGTPFVIKPDDGSKGDEVTLINNEGDLATFIENKLKDKYICQEFIEGADEYRVYTIGGVGVATYKKMSADEDFRANMHAGGSVIETEAERVSPLLKLGGDIARSLGADIAGIDILVDGDTYYFLELNWQPGWEQLDELTGVNFCKRTIQYLLDRAHKQKQPWYKKIFV